MAEFTVRRRLLHGELEQKFTGKKYRGPIHRGKMRSTVTLRVVDVTYGADIVIHRRAYGQSTMSQEAFLEFVKTAKEIE